MVTVLDRLDEFAARFAAMKGSASSKQTRVGSSEAKLTLPHSAAVRPVIQLINPNTQWVVAVRTREQRQALRMAKAKETRMTTGVSTKPRTRVLSPAWSS